MGRLRAGGERLDAGGDAADVRSEQGALPPGAGRLRDRRAHRAHHSGDWQRHDPHHEPAGSASARCRPGWHRGDDRHHDPLLCGGRRNHRDHHLLRRHVSRRRLGAGLQPERALRGRGDRRTNDEIDFEWLGKDTSKVQLNYFVGGVGEHVSLDALGFDAATTTADYAFEWLPDRLLAWQKGLVQW
ncbi:family 16 glycosylhydrolase [Methylobacterium organophilum]|nr:family 16 glycosylhydrolase [Methylobacterium organophilum]